MKRLDQFLVESGMARSRQNAQEKIQSGHIEVKTSRTQNDWKVVLKPSFSFDPLFMEIRQVEHRLDRYVSRAGLKLESAIEKLKLELKGIRALDVGGSTGGFTDCLLQHGVSSVVSVDVGRDQLAEKLRKDLRVQAFEGLNAKNFNELEKVLGNQKFQLIVMDVSFISIALILPNLTQFLTEGGKLLSLVKPQFELGSAALNKQGIVKDSSLYQSLEEKIHQQTQKQGWRVLSYFPSGLAGSDGNQEFFLFADRI